MKQTNDGYGVYSLD